MTGKIPPMPDQPPRFKRLRGWSWPVLNGVVGFLLGLSTGLLIAALPLEEEPGEFTLEGTFLLAEATEYAGECEGTGGFGDIREGAQVTVYDEAGTVVATGSLGPGVPQDEEAVLSTPCRFEVEVPGVPEGSEFYQVEVSHRGKVKLSAGDARAGEFAGSLGP